jgi:predicted DNA-binding ArsR family transcriptional regulator
MKRDNIIKMIENGNFSIFGLNRREQIELIQLLSGGFDLIEMVFRTDKEVKEQLEHLILMIRIKNK